MKYIFNDLRFFIDTQLIMSFKKGNDETLETSQRSHENNISKKKDVVERFLSILWKKEVDFKFSTK